ncbi:hypothetical protein [Magnetospirillum sp. UT-4]|uniref:hypothetical protein n=1 Tax=Magnetospirillum sp. UT-4 TaxID=2681467 RepID=UPI00138056C2|nr:hypothetical protein [Magnetospirillum sp. UT-4]CAA7623357.1 putative 17 kDa surface antigen [Magnetospirillum sp. UT-4]
MVRLAAALVLVLAALPTAPSARADIPAWAWAWAWPLQTGLGPARHVGGNDDYRVVYAAPSGSDARPVYLQSASAARVPVARGLPFGFNRGTCDRDQIGADAADDLLGAAPADAVDRGCVAEALSHLPDGRPIAWDGADGSGWRMMPLRSFSAAGRHCRAFHIAGEGRREGLTGTACLLPEGRWEILD